ncbi:hypothetical protein PAXRUDRAFT_833439 [Paxillus rubicundulus Ve08.2h10]|uniref:UBA domain-containing protein n=1 Tax=Paxillus rubicundulus Ve08.2h10 TaxID=930991 RepID=A0A0D0CY96_9AGAM|nr:hypothetical protein PAXRUDRAFT_833439 [Paxillus rubicundulus Ve08.2h10]
MADSFADLWASSAPTKPAHPPPKLGAVPATQQLNPTYPRRPQQDAFSILSAGQPTTRTHFPQIANHPQPQQRPPGSNNAVSGDAFSGLFSASSGTSQASIRTMTMAERAALANKTKAQSYTAGSESSAATSSTWAGLDSLAQPTSATKPTTSVSSTSNATDFLFDNVQATTSTSLPNINTPSNDDWGLSEFSSPLPVAKSNSPSTLVSISKSAATSKPKTLWDLDDFASPSQPPIPSHSPSGTPRGFDFGDREDGLLQGDHSDGEDTFGLRAPGASPGGPSAQEDDLLGDLAKPVSHPPSPNSVPPTRAHPRLPRRTDSSSPPPHIVGQLVEMGFSPQDACAALSSTKSETGFDVQAAAELLLSQGSGTSDQRSRRPSPELRERDRETRTRIQGTNRPPTTRPDSQSQTLTPGSSHSHSQTPGQTQGQLDITADKLLSQASEIGRGMFSKANALWKEGRERATKIYEERAAAAAGGSSVVTDARPKWMRGSGGGDVERARELEGGDATRGEFRDDDDDRQGTEGGERQRPVPTIPSRRSPQPPPPQPEEINLFSSADAPPSAYQSPFQRGKPKPQLTPTSGVTNIHISTSTQPVTHPSLPNPNSSHTPPRNLTATINASSLATCTSHKSIGTQAYKLGDFPSSIASYALALSALPPHHVLRLPILTNMALVKSKTGDLREVVKDCAEAIRIVRGFVAVNGSGPTEGHFVSSDTSFTPIPVSALGTGKVQVIVEGRVTPTSASSLPKSIDLIEGLTKAYRRRAEAYEGLEKWEMARTDWEVLAGAEWVAAGAKGEALRGAGRCRRIVQGPGGDSAAHKPISKPASSAPSFKAGGSNTNAPASSAALAALRASHDTQASEEALRLMHKDAVDARLASWRAGKEANLRALLTTLDSVLWPELGWKRVGMAEVVGAGQVKGAYVRAIARVHPDKLNAKNTTVEQRMIANGVFGALNEAWNAFQQQP